MRYINTELDFLILTFTVFLIIQFLEWLDEKFAFKLWLSNWSINKTRFIYKLFNCNLCLTFHFSWILAVLVYFINKMDIMYLLTPFCVLGMIKMISNDN